jgi:hypothetical protein
MRHQLYSGFDAAQQVCHLAKLPAQRPARMLSCPDALTDPCRYSNNITRQEDGTMTRLLTLAAVTLTAAITFSALALGADTDPAMGTWQLNLSKSTYTPGTAPKSQTRVYSKSGQSITLVIKTVAADGTQSTANTTYQLDGKDYPISGVADYDTLSAKQIDPNSAAFVLKKSGKRVGTTDRKVSADGKTLTARTKLTTADGQKSASTAVFDKQ